jgi:hypothetical protein
MSTLTDHEWRSTISETPVELLGEGHDNVQLSIAEMVRITTWIDSNCQCYGSYWDRKNLASRDQPNFRRKTTFRETIDTNWGNGRYAFVEREIHPLCTGTRDPNSMWRRHANIAIFPCCTPTGSGVRSCCTD